MDGKPDITSPVPTPLETPWTEERRELCQWFQGNAPGLVSPYEGALRLLRARDFPGRIHMLAHVVRDICDLMPECIASVDTRQTRYEPHLQVLSDRWPLDMRPSLGDYTEQASNAGSDGAISIPATAALAVKDLLAVYKTRRTRREMAEDMFLAISEAQEVDTASIRPIMAEFSRVRNWFVNRAHLRPRGGETPQEVDITRQFAQFERVALSLVRGFFQTMDELDDLIQQANTRTD